MIGFPLDAKHCDTHSEFSKTSSFTSGLGSAVIECNVWGNGLAKGDHGDHADIVSVREYCLGTGLDYLRAIVCAKPSHGVTIMR
ncbi:hypothetical protein N7471_012739 [Penicillium samsonianum]|uniref:uncharacterized protein n=1 Tax=Penicillium samsonianum TaxID=1882272 RepID=UPI0025472187|nr:uncharacterized protein N7471_012739 [Penicillium samsonianum]KAJ6125422.1 hypothetical protein N7471_012739 [Penicillium samsonianum]